MIASGDVLGAARKPGFGVHRRPDGIAFEFEHARKRLRHRLVVVDDEDRGDGRVELCIADIRMLIVADAGVIDLQSRRHSMLHLGVLSRAYIQLFGGAR